MERGIPRTVLRGGGWPRADHAHPLGIFGFAQLGVAGKDGWVWSILGEALLVGPLELADVAVPVVDLHGLDGRDVAALEPELGEHEVHGLGTVLGFEPHGERGAVAGNGLDLRPGDGTARELQLDKTVAGCPGLSGHGDDGPAGYLRGEHGAQTAPAMNDLLVKPMPASAAKIGGQVRKASKWKENGPVPKSFQMTKIGDRFENYSFE